MDVLILGGTGNIGPHFVDATLSRGHAVTIASRGLTPLGLPRGAEHIGLDRTKGLSSITGRDWDAVVDVATFRPGWVRALGTALSGRVGHYVLISSLLAVASPENASGLDEESRPVPYRSDADPFDPSAAFEYGAMKAIAEAEAEAQFPGRTLVLRPGAIVGPGGGMPSGGGSALLYWPIRMALGGEVLVPGDADAPVQFIDVRDLAKWTFRLVERGALGILNAIGPAHAMTWGQLVEQVSPYLASDASLSWIPRSWLREHGHALPGNLSYWQEEARIPGFMRASTDRALAAGASFRPLSETLRDAVSWYRLLPADLRAERVLTLSAGEGLSDSLIRERRILEAWRRGVASRD